MGAFWNILIPYRITVIAALVLWSSYEKMHVYTQETLAFHQLIDRLKEKYSNTFTLAKYVLQQNTDS